jgi:deoxyribodipyrimidine photo-lyase
MSKSKNETKYENGLFIFRRDLRVVDNVGLNLINSICKHIYPIFIFTPEQVTSTNKYKSDEAVQFMIESLENLSSQIGKMNGKLLSFYGKNDTIVNQLIKELDIDIVCFNADYTPYAIQRELSIIQICDKMNITVEYGHDYYLAEPGSIVNGQGDPYQKFTPFYNTALKKKVDSPASLRKIHFASTSKHLQHTISLDNALKRFTKINPDILVHGGRDNAIKQLKEASKNIKHYSKTHNDLSKPTSQLSAYIKFGCISIREVYKVFKGNKDFIRQLYWRDFYANILYSFPYVLGSNLKQKYNKIKWHHNSNWFKKWCQGETGFPIVDAGMRQLNTTGYMHNRARLIVASFLVKTLLISWEEGEKYFASRLTDYDPASNNGNWGWISGGGADSQPYFRIFNPWSQSEEHDPECIYIKTWIPELETLDPNTIHNWETECMNFKDIKYPKPICNYSEQKEKVLKMYKDALNS